jgi:hypothetical protein
MKGHLVTRLNNGRLQSSVAVLGFGALGLFLLYQWMLKG